MADRLAPRQPKKDDQDQPVSPGRSSPSLRSSSVDLHGPMMVKHYISDAETKGLVDFINTVLPDANISTENDDLFERVKDGILLCRLLHAIAPHLFKGLKSFKTSFANENRAQFEKIENYKIFLQAAGRFGCNIVNLDATDLLQGTPHLVLGILWQIVKNGLLKQVSDLSHSSKLPPEEILLSWFNYHLRMAQWPRIVTNFTSDLSDSENLTILMNQLAPEHCDKSPLEIENLLKRAESMLVNAERIQCRKFVSAEDVVKGDTHLIGFVATIFTKFPIEVPSAPSKTDLILNVINKIDVTKLNNAPLEADFSSKETAEQYAILFDSDDDGYITFDDIKNTLESQGISISDHVLEEMYQESGKKTTEKLNYDDFVPFLIKFAALNKKKDLEVQAAQQVEFDKNIEDLQNQVKSLQADKSSLEAQLHQVTGNLSTCNEGTATLKGELEKQKEITASLQSEIEKLRASDQSSQMRADLENQQNAIRSLTEQKTALEKNNNEYKDKLAVQTEQYNLLANSLEQLKQMLHQTKNSLVEQEAIDAELNNELEELQKENEKLKENENFNRKSSEEKLDLVQKELNERDANINEHNALVKILEEKLTQRQEELAKKNEIIAGLENQLRSATDQSEKDHDQLVKDKSAKISELEEALKRKNDELSSVKLDLQTELKQSEENIQNLKSSLNEKEKEFERELNSSKDSIFKLESALTEKENLLVQQENEIKLKIEQINSQQISVTMLESQLKENDAELLKKELSFTEREQELREKLSQSVTDKSKISTNTGILRNEIKLLKETLLNKEKTNGMLQTQVNALQLQVTTIQADPNTTEATLDNKEVEISELKALLAEREKHIQQLIQKINSSDIEDNTHKILSPSTETKKIEQFVKRNRKWVYFGIGCAALGYFIIAPIVYRVRTAVNSLAVLPSLDFLKSTKVNVRYDLHEVLAIKPGFQSSELYVTYNNGDKELFSVNVK